MINIQIMFFIISLIIVIASITQLSITKKPLDSATKEEKDKYKTHQVVGVLFLVSGLFFLLGLSLNMYRVYKFKSVFNEPSISMIPRGRLSTIAELSESYGSIY